MNDRRIIIPVSEMIPIIRAAIGNGGVAEMTVTGNSMNPLLLDRASSVRLARAESVKKGDIVLFRREDGAYVLHRVVDCHDGFYDIVGDNQYTADKNVPEAAIIAKVTSYNRKGKSWVRTDSDRIYRLFLPALKAVRHFVSRVKGKLAAMKRKKGR